MSGGTGTASGCPSAVGRQHGTAGPDFGAGIASHTWPRTSRLDLGSLPSAVPCARLHTKQILWEWNLVQVADNAEIIVSELMTNALHASWSLKDASSVTLILLANHDRLIIQVWDAQPASPSPKPHAIDAVGGRGLEIVSLLSTRWDFYRPASGGKVVWAEISTEVEPLI